MATAAEAQVEGPAPPPPRAGEAPAEASNPAPEKRAPVEREEEDEGEEPQPEPKRRRARVAPLESVPRAANVAAAETASSDDVPAGGCDGEGFTFHARSFVGVETTPKFGSFNPGLVELDALDPRRRPDSTATQEGEEPEGARGGEKETAEGSDGNSR